MPLTPQEFASKRKRASARELLVLVIFSAILLCGISLLWSPFRASGAPTWNGITPGETTLTQLIFQMGVPKEVQTQDNYIRFAYYGDPFKPEYIKGWGFIDVLLMVRNGNIVVVSISRTSQQIWPPFYPSLAEETSLSRLVLENGRPDIVAWSSVPGFRYLMWARKGIAVISDYAGPRKDWSENGAVEILLFEPADINNILIYNSEGYFDIPPNFPCATLMSLDQFPWEGPPRGSRDSFPKDPYDWEHMPTPSATGTP